MSRRKRGRRAGAVRALSERGYTLIELLMVMILSVIVVGVPLGFVVLSLTQQNVSSSRSAAVQQEDVALSRLTRDLRQAVPNTTSTFSWGTSTASASVTLPVPGTGGATTETVVWSCSFSSGGTGSCTRAVNGGTAVLEMRNVESVQFAPVDDQGNTLGGGSSPYTATDPAYIGISVQVLGVSQSDPTATNAPTGISHPIILQDGVSLRNNA